MRLRALIFYCEEKMHIKRLFNSKNKCNFGNFETL